MKYSLTYTGIIVGLISEVLEELNIIIGPDDLSVTVNTVVAILAGLIALYGRYRAGGVTLLGVRRK